MIPTVMKSAWFCAAAAAMMCHAHAAESVLDRSALARPASKSDGPLASLRLDDLAATRERPLFSPSRRPPPLEAATTPQRAAAPKPAEISAPAPAPFDLIGAVVGARESYALLRDPHTHQVTRLRTGDVLEGWTMGAITARSAALLHEDRSETLSFAEPPALEASSAPMLAQTSSPRETSGLAADQALRTSSPVQAEYDRLMRQLKLR